MRIFVTKANRNLKNFRRKLELSTPLQNLILTGANSAPERMVVMTNKYSKKQVTVLMFATIAIILMLVLAFCAIYKVGYGDGARDTCQAINEGGQILSEATTEPAIEDDANNNAEEEEDEVRGKYASYIFEPLEEGIGAWLESTSDEPTESAFSRTPNKGDWIWFGTKHGWNYKLHIAEIEQSSITPQTPYANSIFVYEAFNRENGVWIETYAGENYSPKTPKFCGTPQEGDIIQFLDGLQIKIDGIRTDS